MLYNKQPYAKGSFGLNFSSELSNGEPVRTKHELQPKLEKQDN